MVQLYKNSLPDNSVIGQFLRALSTSYERDGNGLVYPMEQWNFRMSHPCCGVDWANAHSSSKKSHHPDFHLKLVTVIHAASSEKSIHEKFRFFLENL